MVRAPINVMQVVYSFVQGGSESLARDLAIGLDRTRFHPAVCALQGNGPIGADLEKARIPIFVLNRRPGKDWRLIPRLYKLFCRERVRVVQTHHLGQLIYAAFGARLSGAALIHVEHEHFSLTPSKMQRYLRLLAPLCQRVVAVGDQVRSYLVDTIGIESAKISVIYNGVDLKRFDLEPSQSWEQVGLRQPHGLIGFVGRLEFEKDLPTLLQAFRLVSKDYPEARLVVVGEGSLRNELGTLAVHLGCHERVDFLGLRKDVSELLPHFQMCVLPSVNEGLPLAVLEAMACGRPVVATAIGELPSLIQHGVNGLLVPPGDAVSLAKALGDLLAYPEWAKTVGQAARRVAENRFALNRMLGQYQDLYEMLLPERLVRC